jgi:hypothetical protein
MLKVIIFSAALMAVPVFVSIPASADHLGGGPLRSASGKCWGDNTGSRDARFGYWHECPQKAASGSSDCSLGHQAWEKAHVGHSFYDFCGSGPGAKSADSAAGPKSQGNAAGPKSQGKDAAPKSHGIPADAYGSNGPVQPQLTGGLRHDFQLEGRF